MNLIYKAALLLAGWLVLAGATVDIPGYPKDRKNIIQIETLTRYTRKATKQEISRRILGTDVSYEFNFPIETSGGKLYEHFDQNGKYTYWVSGMLDNYPDGYFVILDGSVCITDLDKPDYRLKRCRKAFMDANGNLWLDLPNVALASAVIPTIYR